jgi:hypothetical protein
LDLIDKAGFLDSAFLVGQAGSLPLNEVGDRGSSLQDLELK